MPEQNNEADKVVDIFAGVDKTPEVAPSTNNPVPSVATAETQPYVAQPLPIQGQGHKKFYIIAGVAVIVLVLVIGAIAAYRFSNEPAVENQPSESVTAQEEQKIDEMATTVITGNEIKADVTIQEVAVNEDSDKDGLTDTEEIAAGTNPQKADSDSDGLFDYDEVKKFGTDPLNADTDADSYLDGEEILGGYNPKGPGKLLNFEAELGKVKAN